MPGRKRSQRRDLAGDPVDVEAARVRLNAPHRDEAHTRARVLRRQVTERQLRHGTADPAERVASGQQPRQRVRAGDGLNS